MQKSQIKKVGNCWLLRFYEPVVEAGRTVKLQKTVKLNINPEARTDRAQADAARAAADLILAPINARSACGS
jgi:hypothetical protein